MKIVYNCPICGRDERKSPCQHTPEQWREWADKTYGQGNVLIVDLSNKEFKTVDITRSQLLQTIKDSIQSRYDNSVVDVKQINSGVLRIRVAPNNRRAALYFRVHVVEEQA
jgi:hypothetical protein